MFQPIFNQIRAECSGQAALGVVNDISRYHRIQISPGFRQAAQYVLDTLTTWGVQAQLSSYAAHYGATHWGEALWQEWAAHTGTLHLIEPASKACKLADYRAVPLSLIPRSDSFEGECELVALNKGEELSEYEGLDVKGKLVITSGNVMRVYALAVEKFGAAGIIFDGMRNIEPVCPPMELPDAIQYTSFWWMAQDKRCVGFALSPRRGQWLRELVAQGKPVRLRAKVEASHYDGSLENVAALIAGQNGQEVLVVSHLCHPAPCANDNASGAGAAMEAARALHQLIESGQLPRPKRAIRFLWMAEMTGMYLFLAARQAELGNIIAGLNLDMVGEDQAQTGSVMLIERPCEALPSFAPDLLERLREEFFAEGSSHADQGGFALFRHAVTPFSGGSDHYILSDPQVGIPTPMIIQWPDKFYHTTADTIDKTSPESLARAAALAALYAYWLACAGAAEARWLAHEMNARFKVRVVQQAQAAITQALAQNASGPHLRHKLDFMLERHNLALDSLNRLGELDLQPFKLEAQTFVESEWSGCQAITGEPTPPPDDLPDAIAARVPRRSFPAQLSTRSFIRKLGEAEREAFYAFTKQPDHNAQTLETIAMYWADGKRTLGQIVECVEMETGRRKAQLLAEFFEWMVRLGLASWVE